MAVLRKVCASFATYPRHNYYKPAGRVIVTRANLQGNRRPWAWLARDQRAGKGVKTGGILMPTIKTRVSLMALAVAQTFALAANAQAQSVTVTPPAPQSTSDAAAGQDAPKAAPDSASPPAVAPEDRPTSGPKGKDYDGEIEVTASRLSGGDPTSHVIVITREDIERRGVTSVEDLIRTLPQNLSTIGPITNDRTKKGPLVDRRGGPLSALTTLGVSAANLGGIGAGNTLVLINGRRVAGAAGIEDGFVNLNGIPLSAIERVEILPAGGSAIYGADAMGGVINFILRKGASNLTLTGQYENSSTGADRKRLSAYYGKAWKTGNISLTAEYSKTDPVINAKTGYVTEDYSSYYNNEPSFNFRSFDRGLQPGLVDISGFPIDPQTGAPNFSGPYIVQALVPRAGVTRPGVNDFVTVGQDAAREFIAKYAGPRSESISATFNLDQDITDRLHFFANGLVNRTTNSQLVDYAYGVPLQLAPGQYYNPFAQSPNPNAYPADITNVVYFPAAEIADGSLTPSTIRNRVTNWTVNAGLIYSFSPHTKLNLTYTRSRSSSSASGTGFGSLVSLSDDPQTPGAVSCAPNYGVVSPAQLAVASAQCVALTSSDPNKAFNPWRGSSFAGGADIKTFLFDASQENPATSTQLVEAHLNGNVALLPGGQIQYVVGGEYATSLTSSTLLTRYTGGPQDQTRYAEFLEMNVPIFGEHFGLPLLRTLIANIAVRNDTYRTTGAFGTVNNVLPERGGQYIIRTATFGHVTPAYGVRWEPVPEVSLLGRWTSGFKAPPQTELFSPIGLATYNTRITRDPLYNGASYTVPLVIASNPDLRPEISHSQNFTFSWIPHSVLHGLHFNVTYSHTKISNEFANASDLQTYLPQADIYAIAAFFPRDASGKITEQRAMTFNVIGSEYASLNYELGYVIDAKSLGVFEPSLTVVQNLKAQRQVFANVAPVDRIGTILGPDRYKITGQLTWSKGNWAATMLGYYTPSYINDYWAFYAAGKLTNPQDVKPVRSYTTFDLTVSWQGPRGMRLGLTGRNIFDAAPPFALVDERPYDTARYNVNGRTIAGQLTYTF